MLAQLPTAGMPNGVLWGIGSDATNAAGMEAQGSQEGRNQGAGKGDEGQDRTVRRAAFPRLPLRGLGSRSSRDSSPEAHKESRQTVRASFRSTHTANQRPEIEQLEIPAQGFAPSPFEAGGGPWQDQPVELQVQTWDPGASTQRFAEVHFPTFHACFPLFASQSLGLRVCTGLQSPPATPENPSSAQAKPDHPRNPSTQSTQA